jgi:nitrite reductase (NADH) small subunit
MSEWIEVVALDQIPVLGSRVIKTREMDIAVFRGSDDRVYAVRDACPHKNGPLSQGIMHGHSVTCPLHNWKIDLTNGEAIGPDEGCTKVFPTKVEGGVVVLQLSVNEAAV